MITAERAIIQLLYTLKNKGPLLTLMVPQRTFNSHENVPFHKRLKCLSV